MTSGNSSGNSAEKPTKKGRSRTFKIIVGVVVILVVIIIIAALAGGHGGSGPAMTFQTIGTEGDEVFITLVSPSPDAVSPQDLANRLRQDWQNNLPNGNNIEVRVFDNEGAPQQLIANWQATATMSDQDFATFWASIGPHEVAIYEKNITTGLEDVQILSRDANATVVQTIKF